MQARVVTQAYKEIKGRKGAADVRPALFAKRMELAAQRRNLVGKLRALTSTNAQGLPKICAPGTSGREALPKFKKM